MSSRPPEPPYDPYEPRGSRPYPDEPGYGADPRFDADRRHAGDSRAGYDPRYQADPRRTGDPRAYDDRYDRRSPPQPPASTTVRRRIPLWAILLGLIALVLVGFFAFGLTRSGPGQDRLNGNQASTSSEEKKAQDPAERCGSRQTYDQVKAELFRQAAATRGSDQAVFDRLAAYATLRMGSPVLKRTDESTGALTCSGRASLDLPPGVAVAGGRQTLTADLDYTLQNAADNSGQVVTLAGADAITVPLATLTRTGAASQPGAPVATGSMEPTTTPPGATPPSPAPVPVPAPPGSAPPARPAPPPPPVAQPAPAPAPQASARPGFNCRYAKTRGEIAVCNNPGLAALDRQMTSVYVDALRGASPETYALLHRTRDRFLAFRDRCGSDACMAGAYRDRIREINDIMNGRWQP